MTLGVLATFVGVSLLHALWDAAHGIAVRVTMVLTSLPWQERELRAGQLPELTSAQAHMIALMDWAGLALVSVAGVLWLLWLWSRCPRNGHPAGSRGGAQPQRGAREADRPDGDAGING